jgi:hypothetical protein
LGRFKLERLMAGDLFSGVGLGRAVLARQGVVYGFMASVLAVALAEKSGGDDILRVAGAAVFFLVRRM